MDKSYTYLFVNFFAFIVCFLFSFDKRIQFYKHFGSFLKAAAIVGIPFILWDVCFTQMGVWWFNYDYVIGIHFLGLPLEEWLFFICIPFSCLFTYYCLNRFFDLTWANAFNNMIVFGSSIITLVIALLHYDKWYTLVTAVTTFCTLIYLHFIAKADWIGQASLVFLILMLGFFPVNGVLTGTGIEEPIVNYNPNEFLNIRMLTIPIEDAVYGYTQFLLTLYFFKIFDKKQPSVGFQN
ncbi:lycopene cyclase domain-containing protein [Flavobacterium agrisoli]|uniref:Lycopene cyclase domain-containing protein n=1 Tax=Flavobacterium agrisoli TaxID=2793066 RepID=A0A934UK70_9FLAO|nr:lycopene cyclase domain-containing protein [Flavobacterium agrisoli]MBK0370155.1 lycopene cyclase domain-containing protein [Flavobacterium agrisoli]